MLDRVELAEVAAAFGVSDTQVRRDHLISHILAAVAVLDLPVTFFGGTALARTHLTDPAAGARLSEDIDLHSPDRRAVAQRLDEELPRLLRREFPRSSWDPPLSAVRSATPGQFVSGSGLRVRIQLLDSQGDHHDLASWPVEIRPVHLRYIDTVGVVVLQVPTLTAFAAMKTLAWLDRRTARDLYDLAALARIGAVTEEAAALVRQATGWSVTAQILNLPEPPDWTAQLAHQTRTVPSAAACLAGVHEAYAKALRWSNPDDAFE